MYGNPDPTIRSVSQAAIISLLARVPSQPTLPVTNGRSSGTAALPSSALATPAPSRSATAMTSSVAFERASPDEDGDFLAGVQHIGGASEILVGR